MPRFLSLLIALGACAGDLDPHDLGSCDATWGVPESTSCELACETKPTMVGATCEIVGTEDDRCLNTFELEPGVFGCCQTIGEEIAFRECK